MPRNRPPEAEEAVQDDTALLSEEIEVTGQPIDAGFGGFGGGFGGGLGTGFGGDGGGAPVVKERPVPGGGDGSGGMTLDVPGGASTTGPTIAMRPMFRTAPPTTERPSPWSTSRKTRRHGRPNRA